MTPERGGFTTWREEDAADRRKGRCASEAGGKASVLLPPGQNEKKAEFVCGVHWCVADTTQPAKSEWGMTEEETRTLLAEVVQNEVVSGQAGEEKVRVLALWAPSVQQRFELRIHPTPLDGEISALEEEFLLGSKVLLTEAGERLIHVKQLISSSRAED